LIRIVYADLQERWEKRNGVWAEARIVLRRYGCELRDNYVTKGKLLLTSVLGKREKEWS